MFFQEILDLSDNRNQMSQSAKTVAKVLSEGQTNVTDLESLICLMRSPDLTIIGRSDLSIEDIQTLQEEYQNRFLHSTTEITDSTEISNEIPHSNEHTLKEKISPPHFAHNVKEVFNTIISMKRLSEELKLMEKNSKIKSSDDSTDESVTKNELPEIDLLINKRKVINDDTVSPLREFSGVIDLKVSENNGFLAAAGPPFSKRHGTMLVQPFQWSKSAIKELPHVGQADFWNFDPVAPEWVWN